jgi:hypothetical protein
VPNNGNEYESGPGALTATGVSRELAELTPEDPRRWRSSRSWHWTGRP